MSDKGPTESDPYICLLFNCSLINLLFLIKIIKAFIMRLSNKKNIPNEKSVSVFNGKSIHDIENLPIT